MSSSRRGGRRCSRIRWGWLLGRTGGSLGLRRTEAALLASVSVEYYSRLERGDLAGASDTVLHAIADALLLDEAEREHLFHLARAANASRSGATDNVRRHATGIKRFHQPIVGDLEFLFEGTELMGDPGWTLLIYTAAPGTPTAERVRLLASWTATQERDSAPEPPTHSHLGSAS